MHPANRILLGLTVAASAIACSTSASTPADAGLSSSVKCGAGGLTGTLRIVDALTLGPVAGATVTAPGCSAGATDEQGAIEGDFTQGQLLKVRLAASGYIPEHGEAIPVAGGYYRTLAILPESTRAPLFTGWTKGAGYALVVIYDNGPDAGACLSEGLTVSVKGHPEVPVAYLLADFSGRTGGALTVASGTAAVGPIPPGTYEFDAVKAGCTAGPDNGKYFTWPQTMDVEADTLSVVQVKLP